MSRLMNKAGWIIAGVLGIALLASIAGVVFGGPLDPPGPPTTPTGKTQINSLPYTISVPGSYVVNSDLSCTCSGQDGITIAASAVTLDLQGFALRGSGAGSGSGIIPSGTVYDIEIRNGLVTGWAGAAVLLIAPNSRVEDMRASGNNAGIACGSGVVVQNNVVAGNTSNGIDAYGGCAVTGNTVSGNGGYGIVTSGYDNTITNNTVTGNNSTFGYEAILVHSGDRNWIDGNRISANGKLHAITVTSSFNTITRNFACFTTSTQFNITGANNTFGPTQVGPGTLAANPWANIACA